MKQSERQRRISELTAQLGRILHELAQIGPPDVVSVVLALPSELARYLDALARLWRADVSSVHISMLLHGCYHMAAESKDEENVQRIGAMIRRICTEQEWERFCAQHPDAPQGEAHDG